MSDPTVTPTPTEARQDHDPCCSSHGVAMTCDQYRRTHFVEIRPCCGVDADRLRAEGIDPTGPYQTRLAPHRLEALAADPAPSPAVSAPDLDALRAEAAALTERDEARAALAAVRAEADRLRLALTEEIGKTTAAETALAALREAAKYSADRLLTIAEPKRPAVYAAWNRLNIALAAAPSGPTHHPERDPDHGDCFEVCQGHPEPPAHQKGANAEDCPACVDTNPPYPFVCPGDDRWADKARIAAEAREVGRVLRKGKPSSFGPLAAAPSETPREHVVRLSEDLAAGRAIHDPSGREVAPSETEEGR